MTQVPRAGNPPPEEGEAGRDGPRRVLNVPLLVGTLVALAVLLPAARVWRSRQVARTADVLLQKAEAMEREEKWEEAAEYLRRYLGLHPHDADVMARLAETYERSAQTPWKKTRAVDLYYQAIGALGEDAPADKKHRLRSRLTELLLELSRFVVGYSSQSQREALLLLEPPDRAQAWQVVCADNPALPAAPPEHALWWADYPKVWANAQGARLWVFAVEKQVEHGGFAGMVSGDPPFDDHFDRALELNPGDIELSRVLARIYREEPELVAQDEPGATEDRRAKRADTIINDMAAANPENPEAFLARYEYRIEYELPGAKEDLDQALRYGPEKVEVLLAAAQHAKQEAFHRSRQGASVDEVNAQYEQAAAFCRRAIEVASSQEEGYLELGEVCRAQGKNGQAIEAWRRGLDNCGQQSLTLRSRLAETLIAEGELDQAKEHLDALSRRAKELIPRLDRASRHALASLRDLLTGEWLAAQGRYAEAIPLLRQATVGPEDSELQVTGAWQAWQVLAAVHTELGQWDLAATAHEEAAKAQPQHLPPAAKTQALLAAATAWTMARSPAQAIPLYEQALTLEDNAETCVSLVQARFQRQTALAPGQRNWARFDEALIEAKARSASLAEPWQVTLLEADALVAKGQEADGRQQAVLEALELLRQTEDRYPDSERLMQKLVLAYEGLGSQADADRAMDGVDRLVGASAAACLLRSRLHSHRGEYEKAREVLAKGAETLPPGARTDLEIARLQVSLDEGQLEAAYRQLLELHEGAPANLRFVGQLAELALELSSQEHDLAAVARWEDKLRELEGPEGSSWRYYRARRLLAQARDADDPRFAEAAKLQAYVQGQRHAWPAAYLLAGLLAERRGSSGQAIAAYAKAIRLGERRISVYERLIALLYRQRRFDEARSYLAQLQEHVPSSQALSSLDIRVSAQLGDDARALQAARRGVESRPEDPMARIWLGQMLLRQGGTGVTPVAHRTEEAEAAFLEAVRLAPDDPRTSDALFTYYVQTRQQEPAREVLKRLAENPELSETERSLTLAKGYELLGAKELAQAYYRASARLSKDDVAAQKRLAAFLLGSDPEGAEKTLRRVLQLAPDDREARRTLIHLLAARGGLEEWQEIQQLLEQGRSGEDFSSVDRRLEALLLVQRGGKDNFTKAKQLVEQLVRDPETATPADHLLLANLYEWEGNLYAAEQEYAALVEWAEPEPGQLASYIDFLLRNDRFYDADRWLTRLEDMLPDWLARVEKKAPDRVDKLRAQASLDAARLRARWLYAQDRASEIKPLVDQLANELLKGVGDRPQEKAGVYLRIGDLCSAVKQHQEAEHWYQLLVDLVQGAYEPLAVAKARQGRVDEAIQICITAAESDDSARPAIVMGKVLQCAQPSPESLRLAEPFLSRALRQHPDNVDLLTLVAYLRFLQKRIDDAVELYELVLQRKPTDLLVLNNLATLLGEQPSRRKDALEYIDRAIGIAGPKPGFLDAKGTILVLDGKAEQAVALLEEASSLSADPRCLFHLAVAYQRTGALGKARDALHRARQEDLADQVLTETDKELLAELEKKLGR